ncbi:MAG TPA: anthranilate synthase component I [Candidatus Omnitrophota bacterium]|nr:anthranilate synthase component I [Candidatus Omnitrophota bacterium]HQO58087.1 anthranilate synthase component I [Candidatus Omnitrophota bacterium]
MIKPDLNEFLKLTEQGTLIPVFADVLGDMDTPVSAYYKLADKKGYSFLLESVEGEKKVAQFSFLASNPEKVIRARGRTVDIIDLAKGTTLQETVPAPDSPLKVIRDIMKEYRFVPLPGLPRFCGGLVGYLGYDMVRFFEHLPNQPPKDMDLPEMMLVLAKSLVIFDHLNHKIKVVYCVHIPEKMKTKARIQAYSLAVETIQDILKKLQRPLKPEKQSREDPPYTLAVRSNMSQEHFEAIVKEAQKQIQAGEIIQIVLSQRFEVDIHVSPFYLYRMLRALNPSPYMYYLYFNGTAIVGSSPELLIRCEDGIVETRPIAGTRPRGQDEQEDRRLAADLLRDPKEIAEHIMLVDLGRNDLGRICQKGTVEVSELMAIEKYSHVMHIVSNVKGRLAPGKDSLDVLEAAFPAGTVSGAPKIRAMEIIDTLENVARGPYAGCIGYFSFSGNLDSCITIRTIVAHKGKAYIQAGAGIVADSVPHREYQETMNKARAQVLAIEQAHHIWDNGTVRPLNKKKTHVAYKKEQGGKVNGSTDSSAKSRSTRQQEV